MVSKKIKTSMDFNPHGAFTVLDYINHRKTLNMHLENLKNKPDFNKVGR